MTEPSIGAWLDQLVQIIRNYSSFVLPVAGFLLLVLGARHLLKSSGRTSHGHDDRPTLVSRGVESLIHAFTTNWLLTLLASTALVLSLASGWTTWDGMRNFTGEPILSFMVTFGIQGVMLTIAWIIGESFASGMNQRTQSGSAARRPGTIESVVGLVVGTLCGIAMLTAVANWLGAFDVRSASTGAMGWSALADKALYLAAAMLLIATLVINNRSEIAQPYVQSARIIAKNAVLWIMFLSCMATSVFFSFDSLFTSIFPQAERKRAAEIRAVNQVAGVVADIGALTQRRQAEEAEHLFQSDGWKAYEKNLVDLSKASQGAEQVIEAYFVQQMEARRRVIAEQQERIATSQSGQAGLASKKATLTDELSRLKSERPTLAAELAEKKTELDTRARGIDAKRVEAMAEEKGAEGTLKIGKGPQYRERVGEMTRLQDAYKIQDERVKDAQKRLGAVDTRVAQIERELAALDGDIGKLKGEAQTAEGRIKVMEQSNASEEGQGPKVDPARVRAAFERARAEFRQEPKDEKLSVLAQQCQQLYGAMAATPATKEKVRGIDCDPKQASEAAAHVFALNDGLANFARNCAGGDKLPQTAGTDGLLSFGRKCLQDSGLPSKDSAEMAAKISGIDLNRDDKAHRFVVTWNAFQDGNRLAYLALALAIAIDSLVFMSGLFGANAVRSPLTDLEGRGELTAEQLEAAIDSTLKTTADPKATLAALLRSQHPIDSTDGFTAEIILDPREPHVDEMRQVLVAGATIGAVRRLGGGRDRFLVSTGLARYFAMAQRKTWAVRSKEVDRKELINVVGVALKPQVQANADVVLTELIPTADKPGYAAGVNLADLLVTANRPLVTRVIGAGATVAGAVLRHETNNSWYYVSSDFYKTLLMMSAGSYAAHRDEPHALGHDRQGPPRRLQPVASPQLAPPRSDIQNGRHGEAQLPPPPRDVQAERGTPPPLPRSITPPLSAEPAAEMPRQARMEPRPQRVGGGEADQGLANAIRDEIITLGGLFPWDARDIVIAKALGEGSEPEQALQRLSLRAPKLARLVTDAIEDYRASVHGAYEHLVEHHAGDTLYKDILETIAGELHHLMPILMLSPGGPYQQILEQLVAQLEPQDADGALNPGDRAILARAKLQLRALKDIGDTRPDRYQRIVYIIEQYHETTPQAQAPAQTLDGEQKRTLN